MDKNKSKEIRILKIILWTYIILCILIAGLNYGYGKHATVKVAEFINWFWHFYENWIKTLFIIVCSYLTIKIVGTQTRTIMRKRNLIGFTVTALIVHIIVPIILHNKELYFFTMPLPWTTTPLQLVYTNSSFYQNHYPIWGALGITSALVFYVCFSILVIIGTLLLGRRWQCSTLCLFNGFASEVFAPVMPLIGKNKKVSLKAMKFLNIIRWIFIGIALFFTIWWILFLLGASVPGDFRVISKVESLKYLTTELLMAMFFWVAFMGRGYCYYCPLGTILSLFSRLAGQKIITNNTNCIQCSRCDKACPMSINIKDKALTGEVVKNLRCVGCGHCIDTCPTKTLSYSTNFLQTIASIRDKKSSDRSPIVRQLHNNKELGNLISNEDKTILEERKVTNEIETYEASIEEAVEKAMEIATYEPGIEEAVEKTKEVETYEVGIEEAIEKTKEVETYEASIEEVIGVTKEVETSEVRIEEVIEEIIEEVIEEATEEATEEVIETTTGDTTELS
jgi:ferredoxin-type protein NapH